MIKSSSLPLDRNYFYPLKVNNRKEKKVQKGLETLELIP